MQNLDLSCLILQRMPMETQALPIHIKKRQFSCVHNSNSRCDLYGPKLILSVFCCYHSVALTRNDELLVNVLVIHQVDVVVTIRLS